MAVLKDYCVLYRGHYCRFSFINGFMFEKPWQIYQLSDRQIWTPVCRWLITLKTNAHE